MERFKPTTLDTLDPMEVLDVYQTQESKGYVSAGNEQPNLNLKDNIPNNYGALPTTEEEFRRIQAYIMSEEDRKAKCPPELFDDPDGNIRWLKACMVNLYYEYQGSWESMRRDPRCVSDPTLKKYWQDAKFRLCIKAFDDIFNLKAKSVITDLFNDGDSRVRLAAAQTWLRANESEVWDPGVKKQIVANKGSIANTFFKQVVSEQDFVRSLASDPFSKLSDQARTELRESLGLDDASQTIAIGTLPISTEEVISPRMPSDPFNIEED